MAHWGFLFCIVDPGIAAGFDERRLTMSHYDPTQSTAGNLRIASLYGLETLPAAWNSNLVLANML